MPELAISASLSLSRTEVTLIDVGQTAYGDCIVCRFGPITVLIDGGHPGDTSGKSDHRSLPDQLAEVLELPADKLHVDVLIVTHTHSDHFGCLPAIVASGSLTADWALLADPDLGWGNLLTDPAAAQMSPQVFQVLAALRDDTEAGVQQFSDTADFFAERIDEVTTYKQMVSALEAASPGRVFRYRGDAPQALLEYLGNSGVQLEILGPSARLLELCAQGISQTLSDAQTKVETSLENSRSRGESPMAAMFSSFAAASDAGRAGNFVNIQSLVTLFTFQQKKFLFTGDMQFVDQRTSFQPHPVDPTIVAEVKSIRALIQKAAAADGFDFFKMAHHGSFNGFDDEFRGQLAGTRLYGICTGQRSPKHPDPSTLEILLQHRRDVQWTRTDHNRLCKLSFSGNVPTYALEQGKINDSTPNDSDVAGGRVPIGPLLPEASLSVAAGRSINRPADLFAATTAGGISPAMLRVGDVLLYHGNSFLSRMIRLVDGGDYSHASIYDGSQIMEALGNGINIRGVPASVESAQYVDVFRYRTTMGVELGNSQLPSTPVSGAIQAFEKTPERYAYEQIVLLALLCSTRRVPLPAGLGMVLRNLLDSAGDLVARMTAAGKEPVICSELVFRCYQNAGMNYQILVKGADFSSGISFTEAIGVPLSAEDLQLQQDARNFLLNYELAKGRNLASFTSATNTPIGLQATAAVADLVTPRDLSTSPSLSKVGTLLKLPFAEAGFEGGGGSSGGGGASGHW